MSEARFRRLLPAEDAGAVTTAEALAAELDLHALAPPDRPAVVLNMIASLDGRITIDGRAGPLANRADHEMFHALRGAADAVLVGAGTVRAEGYGAMEQVAVVVSRSLDLSPDLGLLRASGNRVIVITGPEGELPPCAAQVEYLRSSGRRLDLEDALRRLRAEHSIGAVVCEGGAHLNAALLPSRLVDEIHLVISSVIVGGKTPLTMLEGPLLEPPITGTLRWLLEADGLLFTRYALA